MIKFLQPSKRTLELSRQYAKHNKKYLYKEAGNAKQYENIIYYPRTPDHEDPSIGPAKLFRVQRVKPLKGNPYWENKILKELGLDGKQSNYAVIKNIPENNARLWKIKHLIKVIPITFPYGEPTELDINYTILKENGECVVTKEIKIDEKRLEATDAFQSDPKLLDGETLRKDSRLKWLNPW